MDNRTDYFLLLGDLEGSSRMDPPTAGAAGDALSSALSAANATFATDIAAQLEINYGDEFAGLFHRPGPIWRIVWSVRDALRPSGFRFAVARGRVGRAAETTREMGGPVFKTASDLIDRLKIDRRFGAWRLGGEPRRDATLEALTGLSHAAVEAMTDYQYAVYRGLRAGETQTDLAARLDKFPQSISDAVRRGQAELVLEAEAVIDTWLQAEDQ